MIVFSKFFFFDWVINGDRRGGKEGIVGMEKKREKRRGADEKNGEIFFSEI